MRNNKAAMHPAGMIEAEPIAINRFRPANFIDRVGVRPSGVAPIGLLSARSQSGFFKSVVRVDRAGPPSTPSRTINRQPVGGAPQLGSGVQPGGGSHPAGGVGQPGAGLNRNVIQTPTLIIHSSHAVSTIVAPCR